MQGSFSSCALHCPAHTHRCSSDRPAYLTPFEQPPVMPGHQVPANWSALQMYIKRDHSSWTAELPVCSCLCPRRRQSRTQTTMLADFPDGLAMLCKQCCPWPTCAVLFRWSRAWTAEGSLPPPRTCSTWEGSICPGPVHWVTFCILQACHKLPHRASHSLAPLPCRKSPTCGKQRFAQLGCSALPSIMIAPLPYNLAALPMPCAGG